jgi:hypothetical protein
VAVAATKAVVNEYARNRTYYNDVVKFNFANSVKSNKEYRSLEYWDLPREIRDRIQRLYGRYRNMKVSSIYRNLGMRATNTNNSMPLETKYVFTYYKKYGILRYNPHNRVYDDEILRVLSYSEEEEISRFF